MSENKTDLGEILIYKDFHKERRYLVYYLLIYLIIYLTYIIFIKENYGGKINEKFLIQLPFSQFNNLLNNLIDKISQINNQMIFESGEINIPLITSAIIFLLIGFKTPNNLTSIIILNIIFQVILIFVNKSGNIITYPLFNILSYKFGSSIFDYFFGDIYLNNTENVLSLNN